MKRSHEGRNQVQLAEPAAIADVTLPDPEASDPSEPVPEPAAAVRLLERLPGKFISFEGCEGTGKTTQIALLAAWLKAQGAPLLETREPGGTPMGQTLRSLVLTGRASGLSSATELFILLADRSQHVSEVIRPAIAEGLVVLCDRFTDSTLAYQGYGGDLDLEMVTESCRLATGGLQPDLTLLLDLDPEIGFARIHRSLDRMEQKGMQFHRKVREGYLQIARDESGRVVVVDAARSEVEVAQAIREAVTAAFL